jgi:hypothetical protein
VAGDGVFATRAFDVGETVVVAVIASRVEGVRLNESGGPDLVALRSIAAGEEITEEITFDYAMWNYSIEHFPSRCLCGSKICRGSVTGWKDLPDDRKEAYQDFVAPYLLELDRE